MRIGRIWRSSVLGESGTVIFASRPFIVAVAVLTSVVGLSMNPAQAAPADHFVTTWKTDNQGGSSDTEITVPMVGGPYNVDWDSDGTFDEFGLTDMVTHDFGVAGTYQIRIDGIYASVRFGLFFGSGDQAKIISVDQWGTQQWTSMEEAFIACSNLQVLATDIPDFSAVTSMARMFATTQLVNPDTSGWDTSSVTNMYGMFIGAVSANPDTSGWDTSSVTDMREMFSGAASANPDTSGWDTSAVTDMSWMFFQATSANPDTSGWDTSAVTNMGSMFVEAISANPDTSGWDTSAVTMMDSMFIGATSANPDTSGWNTSSVTNMKRMFQAATSANPDTSGWDTSAVTDMSWMFFLSSSANPETSSWNTSSVTDMSGMFRDNPSANPDTSGWNTSAVSNMRYMFYRATSANPDTSGWDVTSLTNATDMFHGVKLSTANYEALLINWNAQALQPGVAFHGGNSTYCSDAAATARANMISSDGWTIADGGQDCSQVIIFADGFEQLQQCTWMPDSESPGCLGWEPGEPYPSRTCSEVECQIPPPGEPGYEPGWEYCVYICVDQP